MAIVRTVKGRSIRSATDLSDETDSSRGTVTGTRQNWVTGTFTDRDSAERAYNLMLSRGYGVKGDQPDDVG